MAVVDAGSLDAGARPATPQVTTTTFSAFATSAIVAVADDARLASAAAAVRRTVAEFDAACSRFRPDSELSGLNAAAGRRVHAGALLLEAVAAALRAAEVTHGDVDPTVGRALIALGYDRDFSELDDERLPGTGSPPRSIASVPGWRAVTIDAEAATIRVPRGVSLDLGATAKALAADHAAHAAAAEAQCGVLVSLGGDIATAGAAPAGGWPVRVTDDHRDAVASPGQWISLSSGGLATSSTTARRWQTRSGPAHHLIDPATGRCANGFWRTATVAAASCLDANTASTAAIIRGRGAEAWLESMCLPARLVGANGSVRHLAGWPHTGEELP